MSCHFRGIISKIVTDDKVKLCKCVYFFKHFSLFTGIAHV